MDMSNLVHEPYLQLLVAGIVVYFATFFLFIEKVENRVKAKKTNHDDLLKKKHESQNISLQIVISTFDSLRENRIQVEKAERITDALHWSGLMYLAGCILAFTLKMSGIQEDLGQAFIGAGFLYFFIILVYLLFWYRREGKEL